MTYQSVPEFYCGSDLAQPTGKQFVKVLCRKIGINSNGIKASSYSKMTALDSLVALRVSGANAKQKVDAIISWFWDDKKHLGKNYKTNSMLKFHRVN